MSELEEILFEYRSKLEFLNSNGLLDDFYDEYLMIMTIH